MDTHAKTLVKNWYETEKGIHVNDEDVYTVWKCKIIQNWKFLLSTTIDDGMYFEATYNGDKDEVYLDAYKLSDHKTYNYNKNL